MSGEVRPLVKEQRLLEIRIEVNNKEIEALRNEIQDMGRDEDLLLIEKCILERELRLIEIGSKLEKLKAEQTRLMEEKSRVSEILAKMGVCQASLAGGQKHLYIISSRPHCFYLA